MQKWPCVRPSKYLYFRYRNSLLPNMPNDLCTKVPQGGSIMGSSGIKKDAIANYGTNATNAASAVNTINPIYSSMATDPQGYTPTQKANALTASSQSAGGGVASSGGQGGLLAARTGNAAGATPALDVSAPSPALTNTTNPPAPPNPNQPL